MYRIATNRCLNALRDTGRRPQQQAQSPAFEAPEPTRRTEPTWFEPYPDALLADLPDASPGPEARYETWEALALAFVEVQGLLAWPTTLSARVPAAGRSASFGNQGMARPVARTSLLPEERDRGFSR